MTVTDTTPKGQTELISFDFDLNHPPEKVWRAITQPELLAQWLLPTIGYKLEQGAEFTFNTQPVGGWDGIVHSRITAIETERRLVYTWDVGDMATVVTFTLEPTESGTRLSLLQSGFREDQKQNSGGARYGWKMMGGRLVDLLGRIS